MLRRTTGSVEHFFGELKMPCRFRQQPAALAEVRAHRDSSLASTDDQCLHLYNRGPPLVHGLPPHPPLWALHLTNRAESIATRCAAAKILLGHVWQRRFAAYVFAPKWYKQTSAKTD